MQSQRYIPARTLSEFVHCFWYWQGAPQRHARERLLPNGECSIIINLLDDPIRTYEANDLSRWTSHGLAILSGARADCFAIDTSQQERVVGVQFRAGGVYPFLRVPASEIEGISINLADVWGNRAAEIRELLLSAVTIQQVFTVLECSLLLRMAQCQELHGAVAYAAEQFQRPGVQSRIAEVSSRIGLSSRRFIQLFHEQVGLTPKAFSRVRRFQDVLRSVHQRQAVNWTQVALDCGYYDQAHFIHEFRAFSGLTPTAYLAAATPHLNHVPLA